MLLENERGKGKRAAHGWRAGLVLALGLMLSSGAARAQSDEDKAAARTLATQGAEALNNKKYAEAIDLVSRAEAIVHAPTHLLMIARAQVGVGKLVAARETYLKLTREELAANAPAAFKRAQSEGKEDLAALEPRIASLRIVLEGPGQKNATVKLDDAPVSAALIGVHRPVDPGAHEVVAYPTGQSPVKGSITLKEGEKREIKLTLAEAPLPGVPANPADNPDAGKPPVAGDQPSGGSSKFMTPLRGAGIGVGAVGLGGIIVGAIFIGKGSSTQSQADAAFKACNTKPDCAKAPENSPKKKAIAELDTNAANQKTIATIGFIAGGVALAGGITMIVLGKPKADAPAKTGVTPWFTGTSAGLSGTF